MKTLAKELREASNEGEIIDSETIAVLLPDELQTIVQCKEAQLDEIVVLESIFDGTGEFLVTANSGDMAELRETVESISHGGFQDVDAMRAVAMGPLLSFVFQLTIPDTQRRGDSGELELEACIVLQVTLPLLYPTTVPPLTEFKDVMVTDVRAECFADKRLASLAYLEEGELRGGMVQLATEMQPGPCVYELVATYLPENAFAHIRMHAYVEAP
mmetsp:Transcript_28496/g.63596  ORF Transcript_28496/g.63596 Transcript_28496/m.63596 type:complete len:215 (+) Transcript_28496:445-1089(+)